MTDLLTFLLSSLGVTILIVWPDSGPSAWLREHLLRSILPGPARAVLDCYICLGFWVGLLLSPVWWAITHESWAWAGCFMTPALFWIVLRPGVAGTTATSADMRTTASDDGPSST